MSEQMQFQAEVSRLLDIVAHALYTEKEIFLRELISNASDACDRLRYEAITKPELLQGDSDFKITVTFDAPARRLVISDNGIGMDREQLIKNLGTIAHSGTREVLKNMGDGQKKDVNLIGQFGVGFYSSFMVAQKVEVLSRRAGEKKAYVWTSDGRGSYTVDEALKDTRGTEITLHLTDDASEFLLEERLKNIIKKYSDHINFPIELNGQVTNAASALWMRSKSDVTPEQYAEFYRNVSGAMAIDEPWMTFHWRSEGVIENTNLIFIPTMRPFDLYDPKRHHGVKLYVKRVFIADGVEALIPPFLRFVKGVVDSEDLPLNISREMLQASPIMAKMSSAIVRKILTGLEEKAKEDIKSFENFWALFGSVLKEGLYDAHAYRDQLCRVARFYSSTGEGLVSLDEYIERMPASQEVIYYMSAPSVEAARNSPQLEAFRAKNIEVLFMTDTVDEFWLPIQNDYKNKKFKSITKGAADISKDAQPEATPDMQKLIDKLKALLTGEVQDVRLSERLVDSAVCLVAPESEIDMQMQRLLKKSQGYEAAHRPILEINGTHPLIAKLQKLVVEGTQAETVLETTMLLLDQARIIEGEPLKNPADFARRMAKVMEKGMT
jgi:molecular chaperone HtpG